MSFDQPTEPLLGSTGLPALAVAELRSLDRVIALFQLRLLPRQHWTRQVRLAIGLRYLLRYGFEEGLRRLRQRIRAYDSAFGIRDEYHETKTVYTMWALTEFRRRNPLIRHRILLYRRLLEDRISAPDFLSRVYSPERLADPVARRRFLEPDRMPLPSNVRDRLTRATALHAASATTIPGTLAVPGATPC